MPSALTENKQRLANFYYTVHCQDYVYIFDKDSYIEEFTGFLTNNKSAHKTVALLLLAIRKRSSNMNLSFIFIVLVY